jgi:hypothetical protein
MRAGARFRVWELERIITQSIIGGLSEETKVEVIWRGDGLAINMSRQRVCVLRVRVPLLLPRVGILASDMAYGVIRQGFDPGLHVFLCQQ